MSDTHTATLVEDSHYDHEHYGRVRLVSIDTDAGDVLFECLDGDVTHVQGIGSIPVGVREPLSAFQEQSEPATITLQPPSATIDTTGTLSP